MLAARVLLAALGVVAQGQFSAYPWHPIYPRLALLAGIGLDALWTWAAVATSGDSHGPITAQLAPRETLVAGIVGVALSAVVLLGAVTAPVLVWGDGGHRRSGGLACARPRVAADTTVFI